MAGAELPATARKPAVQGLRGQQKKEMEREVADRFSATEEMAVERELVTSAKDATSGGTALLSAQRQIQLDSEAHMWRNRKKQQHLLKRQKMPQKQEKI